MPNTADKIRTATLIELRRAAKGKAGGKGRRLKRPPRILWPAGIERSYRKSLLNILADLQRTVERRLAPAFPALVQSAQAARPTTDHARVDDYGSEVEKLLELIRTGFFGEYSDARIATLVSEISAAVATDNKRQLGGVFKDVLGVDPFHAEPWLNAEANAFVTQNVGLIKTISNSYIDRVEGLVYDGARRGLRWEEMQANLVDLTPSTTARAEVIARDQIGKFNGQLTELRQTQAGVNSYIWRTAGDARVREEHAAREGKVFDWSAPPSDGHPGEAIQCRCYAEPVLSDLAET